MSAGDLKKAPSVTISTRPRASSEDSFAPSLKPPSLKSPRTARFAEATAVNSPIEPGKTGRSPFADPPTTHYMAQPQPSDVGFGYMNKHESVEMPDEMDNHYLPPLTPKTPLKSAMKTPGAAPRAFEAMRSPTFKEEEVLEKHEEDTDKMQAKDLKVKTRVRMAKMLLRGVNFSCSLIVLSMLSATFTIFNATKSIPPRNNLPPWAENGKTWPQITLLVISCISLVFSMAIIYGYKKGGHKRAEKAATYYTAFAVAFFAFSIVMWGIGAGVLQGAKANSNGQDIWGWSCKDNARKQLFQNEVSYDLICRLQNWSLLCCIIEVIVETITIAIYGVVFYRFYSKRQLRKSMAVRDRARSDLYLAQLRSQSAPNTPGFGPLSPRDGGWKAPVDYYNNAPAIEEGGDVQYVDLQQKAQPKPFQLQPPPIKIQGATPKMQQAGFAPINPVGSEQRERTPSPPMDQRSPILEHYAQDSYVPQAQRGEQQQEHFGAAPNEPVYDSVPIPGAYSSPLSSPTLAPRQMGFPEQS